MTEEVVTELKYARARIRARARESANSVAAIKALDKELEQDSILDKIRAEVINLTDSETPERIWNVDVLQIIDKYRVGNEVEE